MPPVDPGEDGAKEGRGVPGKRQAAIYACRTLNYFVGDLVSATRTRQIMRSLAEVNGVGASTVQCLDRFSLGYLFLTLCKWIEFYERFLDVIPEDCRDECKSLYNRIRSRGIPEFRNTFVGHIWDKKRGRPLTPEELEAAGQTIVEGDPNTFCSWCNNPDDNEYPRTVVSIVERVRDRLIEEYALTEAELFPDEGGA